MSDDGLEAAAYSLEMTVYGLTDRVAELEEENDKLHEVVDGWKFRAQKAEEEAAKLREALEEMVTMYGGGGVTEPHSAKTAALDKACKALGKKENSQ